MAPTAGQLTRHPFPSGIEPSLYFEGLSQREALARLRFVADCGRRLAVLLGSPGVGKSLLLEVFAQERRNQGEAVAQLELATLTPREFYWSLGNQLQAPVRMEHELMRLVRTIGDRIHENQLQAVPTVVLLDDADRAGPDLLAHVERLVRSDSTAGNLSFVLSARPGDVGRLGESLLDLSDLPIELQAWDELDTIGYLQLALVSAGYDRPLFDDAALAALHSLADGVPRRVNRLAGHALLAAGNEPGPIDAAAVRLAHQAITLR